MYDEMTVLDLIATAFEKVNAGDEHGPLITELASRLSRAQVYRENLARVVDPYLREEDGTDLIPDHARIANMLERLSLANANVDLSDTAAQDSASKSNNPAVSG